MVKISLTILIVAVAALIITAAVGAVAWFMFMRKIWAELFKDWNKRDR